MTTKQAALQKLKAARDSFWFSLGAYALLTKEPARTEVANFSISVTNQELLVEPKTAVVPQRIGTSYRIEFNSSIPDESALSVVQRTFYAMITDSYDAAKSASELQLKAQDWYHLARHLRNAIAHNGRWHFQNLSGLPCKWRHLVIDSSMQDQPIQGFIGWYDGLQLGAVMQLFVDGLPDEA